MENSQYKTNQQALIKWGWLRALLFLITTIALNFTIYKIKGRILPEHFKAYDIHALYYHLIKLTGIILLIILFRKTIDKKSILSLGFNLKLCFRKDMFYGIGIGILSIFLVFIILLLTGAVSIKSIQFRAASFLFITPIFIIAVIREEISNRGYILNNMMDSMNKYIALLVVSAFFALMHADNPNISIVGLINIFLGGLFLGIYYIHKRNLWFPIGLHFGWNFTLGSIVGSPVSGYHMPSIFNLDISGNKFLSSGDYGFEGSIIVSVILILSTLLIHFKLIKLTNNSIR